MTPNDPFHALDIAHPKHIGHWKTLLPVTGLSTTVQCECGVTLRMSLVATMLLASGKVVIANPGRRHRPKQIPLTWADAQSKIRTLNKHQLRMQPRMHTAPRVWRHWVS